MPHDPDDSRLLFFGIRYLVETYLNRKWTLEDVERAAHFYRRAAKAALANGAAFDPQSTPAAQGDVTRACAPAFPPNPSAGSSGRPSRPGRTGTRRCYSTGPSPTVLCSDALPLLSTFPPPPPTARTTPATPPTPSRATCSRSSSGRTAVSSR